MADRIDIEAIAAASVSDIGRTRSENQDACGDFRHAAGERLLILADGMGGHRGGATASRVCVDAFARVFKDQEGPPQERLRQSFELANEEIYAMALADAQLRGMGTTGVALLFGADGSAWVGWVGDSRAYRWREDSIEPLTEDHSLVGEWVRLGILSEEEAATHPRRSELTRAVGVTQEVEPDVHPVEVRPGDRFLLCSDGLCGLVPEAEISTILGSQAPKRAVRSLVDRANELGGPDNVTVQIAHLPLQSEPAAEESQNPEQADIPPDPPSPAPPTSTAPEPTRARTPDVRALNLPPTGPRRKPPPSARGLHLPSLLVGAGGMALATLLALGACLLLLGGWIPGLTLPASSPVPEPGVRDPVAPTPITRGEPVLPEPPPPAPSPSESPPLAAPAAETLREPAAPPASGPTPTGAAVPAPPASTSAEPDSAGEPAPPAPPLPETPVPDSAAAEPPKEVPAAPAAPEPAESESTSAAARPAGALEVADSGPASETRAVREEVAPAPPPEIPDFGLAPAVHQFLEDWLRAAATRDFALYRSLGFPDPPNVFQASYGVREAFRVVEAEVDAERSRPGLVYLRLVLSYAFEDERGRWRTEDEHRLVLRQEQDGFRYEARWK